MGGSERSEAHALGQAMTFITGNDLGAGVAFLRAIADDDEEALVIALEAIENPHALLGQFGGCLIDYVNVTHDLNLGPTLDEVLEAWGIASATLGDR
jgi:hypothetical protein